MARAAAKSLMAPATFVIVELRTLDACGPTRISRQHTDRDRLAAHIHEEQEARRRDYGPLPPGVRLVVVVVSIYGAISAGGHRLLQDLSRHTGGVPPLALLDQASWSACRFAPMARMAITFAVRRGLAAAVRAGWERRRGPDDAPSDADDGGDDDDSDDDSDDDDSSSDAPPPRRRRRCDVADDGAGSDDARPRRVPRAAASAAVEALRRQRTLDRVLVT